jgi:hypothetical protein
MSPESRLHPERRHDLFGHRPLKVCIRIDPISPRKHQYPDRRTARIEAPVCVPTLFALGRLLADGRPSGVFLLEICEMSKLSGSCQGRSGAQNERIMRARKTAIRFLLAHCPAVILLFSMTFGFEPLGAPCLQRIRNFHSDHLNFIKKAW